MLFYIYNNHTELPVFELIFQYQRQTCTKPATYCWSQSNVGHSYNQHFQDDSLG